MSTCDVTVQQHSWSQCRAICSDIRRQVFILEQKVPENEEWDGRDDSARHFVAYLHSTQNAVACARLLLSATDSNLCAKITRMAVLRPYRTRGIGSALLQEMLVAVRKLGCAQALLDAQTPAVDFYARAGFNSRGKPFWDAGIEHIKMVKTLV